MWWNGITWPLGTEQHLLTLKILQLWWHRILGLMSVHQATAPPLFSYWGTVSFSSSRVLCSSTTCCRFHCPATWDNLLASHKRPVPKSLFPPTQDFYGLLFLSSAPNLELLNGDIRKPGRRWRNGGGHNNWLLSSPSWRFAMWNFWNCEGNSSSGTDKILNASLSNLKVGLSVSEYCITSSTLRIIKTTYI